MHARFYHPAEITVGQCIELSHENKHHAMRTLRLRKGDSVTLFNGLGGEFLAHIQVIDNSDVKVLVEKFLGQERESSVVIELAQAICTNEKMDWIIQKAVELGVNRIQPISTERSIVQLSNERANKRLVHWEKIIISACEQSGRNLLPKIFPLISLSKWLDQKQSAHTDREMRLMLSPTSEQYLKNITRPPNNDSITLMIGPEGGFSQTEELSILQGEYTSIRLGNRILRTETAGLAIIAAIQTLWGDF
ncbi:MAG: 16S rRNA (uracil(1498)-N(3))-methyltransferase [Nitrosomonas sp.]|nr:16S rRNA (uracil(1498)-N(3))-methyltransferase [Nitrosomonas sp.]HRB28646.1 16S rRNA (uracil(1498)-N(3))-methyltransferase [Nitrosomonas sp.]